MIVILPMTYSLTPIFFYLYHQQEDVVHIYLYIYEPQGKYAYFFILWCSNLHLLCYFLQTTINTKIHNTNPLWQHLSYIFIDLSIKWFIVPHRRLFCKPSWITSWTLLQQFHSLSISHAKGPVSLKVFFKIHWWCHL